MAVSHASPIHVGVALHAICYSFASPSDEFTYGGTRCPPIIEPTRLDCAGLGRYHERHKPSGRSAGSAEAVQRLALNAAKRSCPGAPDGTWPLGLPPSQMPRQS